MCDTIKPDKASNEESISTKSCPYDHDCANCPLNKVSKEKNANASPSTK